MPLTISSKLLLTESKCNISVKPARVDIIIGLIMLQVLVAYGAFFYSNNVYQAIQYWLMLSLIIYLVVGKFIGVFFNKSQQMYCFNLANGTVLLNGDTYKVSAKSNLSIIGCSLILVAGNSAEDKGLRNADTSLANQSLSNHHQIKNNQSKKTFIVYFLKQQLSRAEYAYLAFLIESLRAK